MKKGFVISLSALLIVIFLVIFASYYLNKNQRNEKAIIESYAVENAGFIEDDIMFDINKLLGNGISIDRNKNYAVITFSSRIPRNLNIKTELTEMQNFYDKNYSKKQNINLSTDLNELKDGKAEIKLNNGLQFEYLYDANSLLFVAPNGDTNALTIDINIFVDTNSVKIKAWNNNPTGDTNINLNYFDTNNSNKVSFKGKLSSTGINQYDFNFSRTNSADALKIRFGNIDGNIAALQIAENISKTANVKILIKITIEATKELIAYYEGDLNYSQADVNVNKKFELFKS